MHGPISENERQPGHVVAGITNLIGLAHAGQLPVTELPHVRDIIIDGYMQGIAEEQFPRDRHHVAYGMDGALAIRSAFTALPLDRLTEPPKAANWDSLIHNRLQLTRYLCNLSASPSRCPASEVGTSF